MKKKKEMKGIDVIVRITLGAIAGIGVYHLYNSIGCDQGLSITLGMICSSAVGLVLCYDMVKIHFLETGGKLI